MRPDHIAFLMGKDENPKMTKRPRWLVMLKPLFSGVITADNLDYVLRDAYMCGVAERQVDLDRLIYYTFFTKSGLTLHKSGLPAFRMFLNARSYLYSNVYFHRTTRALDIHLRDIFPDTMKEIFPYNPIKNLNGYLELTDWSLLTTIRSWKESQSAKKRALFLEWRQIFLREVKWKMAYDATFSSVQGKINELNLEKAIRKQLPAAFKQIPFRVDMAVWDPRPLNPLMMGDRQIYVYNPSAQLVSKDPLMEFMDTLPATLTQCRIFSLNHDYDLPLSRAAEDGLQSLLKGI